MDVLEGKPNTSIYTGQDGTVIYGSSDKGAYDDSKNAKITYSLKNGKELAIASSDFENNGQWKAGNKYGRVEIEVKAAETDSYLAASESYWVDIIQVDYNNYSAYWDIAGTKYKDTDIYTDFSGIVPKADSADGNTYVINF